jgi:MFS family permease
MAAPIEPAASKSFASRLVTRTSKAQIGIVLSCLIGNIVSSTPVVNTTLGVFLVPISREFQWPRERVSGVLTLLAVVSALAFPIVGSLADKFGSRRLILFGNLCFGICVIGLGFSTGNVFLFYGTFALIGIFGSLPSTMMFNRVVAGWFDAARGRMLGLSSGLGNGLGATIMPFAALILMREWGWRGAFIGLGAIVIAAGFPTFLFLLKEPPLANRGQASTAVVLEGMTLVQAARTSSFWLVLIAIGLGAGCLTAVLAHVVPFLSDRGISVNRGVVVVSVFALVGSGWMIVVGWLLDRFDSPKIIAPLYLISVVGTLALEHGTTLPVLVLGGALMGIGLGSEFGALSYFISRYFGFPRFGTIAGVMYSAVTISLGITPFLMDVDFDHNKSYLLSLHVIEVALVAGAVMIACLPRYESTMALWRKISPAT